MKGIHLPNKEISNDEIKRIVDLHCSDYVDLNYWPNRWSVLKQLNPNCRIHVRIDCRGPLTPKEDACAIRDLVTNHSEVDTVRIRNEPNLESQCTPEEWKFYLKFLVSQINVPKFRIPAISPGLHGWVAYAQINAEIAREYNMKEIDAHIYGNISEFETTLAQYEKMWDGSLLVTEHNFGAGRSYAISQWAADYSNIFKLLPYHKISAFCEFIWEWDNADMVLPTPVNVKDTMMEKVIGETFPLTFGVPDNFSSPNTDGPRGATRVIVLHGTQGGSLNLHTEFVGAMRYHCNPNSGVSSNAIVGSGEIGYPVPMDNVAWHCREYNDFSIGIELVQPRADSTIPTNIFNDAAKLVASLCKQYNIPAQWSITNGICEHRETPPGIREGKQDLGTLNRDAFLAAIKQNMGGPVQPTLTQQRKTELKVLPEWYLACVGVNQDWTFKTKDEFVMHLKGIGADWQHPEKYGWK